jgi:hypothetical protein
MWVATRTDALLLEGREMAGAFELLYFGALVVRR